MEGRKALYGSRPGAGACETDSVYSGLELGEVCTGNRNGCIKEGRKQAKYKICIKYFFGLNLAVA